MNFFISLFVPNVALEDGSWKEKMDGKVEAVESEGSLKIDT